MVNRKFDSNSTVTREIEVLGRNWHQRPSRQCRVLACRRFSALWFRVWWVSSNPPFQTRRPTKSSTMIVRAWTSKEVLLLGQHDRAASAIEIKVSRQLDCPNSRLQGTKSRLGSETVMFWGDIDQVPQKLRGTRRHISEEQTDNSGSFSMNPV
jgi:hypothetical protein